MLEFWASPEATIARLDAERYRDQRADTGHLAREDDIERLAALGVTASRYPVLWESVAPSDPRERDYTWEARRLGRLERCGVEPIVTLLHHGGGPRYTSLLDDAFPELFADYAEATARRFPNVRWWTPVNEPLTTARFSALYGAWYPRARDDRAFAQALVNEVLGYLLAAERISRVVPGARFMLTEDIQSFTVADAGVAEYAAHKRERVYLSTDLACGNVDARHLLWPYLVGRCEVPVETLKRIRRLARPPDLLGWNYYPNSERYLWTNEDGTFGNIALVDVDRRRLGLSRLLRAAWQRFALPMALSEVHVYGNEAERARWLLQRYADVIALRDEGVDIRAFGAWAAFGMVDWTSLLCEQQDRREDGLYTCVPGDAQPQPTLAAEALRGLCSGTLPALAPNLGWWERERTA